MLLCPTQRGPSMYCIQSTVNLSGDMYTMTACLLANEIYFAMHICFNFLIHQLSSNSLTLQSEYSNDLHNTSIYIIYLLLGGLNPPRSTAQKSYRTIEYQSMTVHVNFCKCAISAKLRPNCELHIIRLLYIVHNLDVICR